MDTQLHKVSSYGVHPRVCGETGVPYALTSPQVGPSPRVRGNLTAALVAFPGGGSIPACAGKPRSPRRRASASRVHPRVCGETAPRMPVSSVDAGPSPRVRGNLRPGGAARLVERSIPACAGKPEAARRRRRELRVHPRVCGETRAEDGSTMWSSGPSPRVRGNPDRTAGTSSRRGSIPACAGKPTGGCWPRSTRWVHPRVCGETRRRSSGVRIVSGPSPRVRGNRPRSADSAPSRGSIPACAGKPWRMRATRLLPGVHPRVCGETAPAPGAHPRHGGPSPRVRGNQRHRVLRKRRQGSIPACAGKPAGKPAGPCGHRVHPRVCGETGSGGRYRGVAKGPSPRVRGNRPAALPRLFRQGSIPACAGKPSMVAGDRARRAVHPRVCGETLRALVVDMGVRGPSPRVRGNRRRELPSWATTGSIPACAGKPCRRRSRWSRHGVHPRVCGETGALDEPGELESGPSPRVRGNRGHQARRLDRARSIPACAGKPPPTSTGRAGGGVHPRVCGETLVSSVSMLWQEGPSPRVRGNPHRHLINLARAGSIPACAGKPPHRWTGATARTVHPRVCGETTATDFSGQAPRGPSPRVRGNLLGAGRPAAGKGSIPACAGKPSSDRECPARAEVHPRVCGETVSRSRSRAVPRGPSPRVRGNLLGAGRPAAGKGSIPACAGKPSCACRRGVRCRVHPRVCGETGFTDSPDSVSEGPSPRVRGNLLPCSILLAEIWSIPACAGKPCSRRTTAGRARVHPRVCGETVSVLPAMPPARGPSPRVRGNRPGRAGRERRSGSIPACAGKPQANPGRQPADMVHPRVCGETACSSASARTSNGPSPRVRGNRHRERECLRQGGSIPACAGKPWWLPTAAASRRVHPRVCGETRLRFGLHR